MGFEGLFSLCYPIITFLFASLKLVTSYENVEITNCAEGKFTALKTVVHLDLRISSRIFEKFDMVLILFLGSWGKLIHEKT